KLGSFGHFSTLLGPPVGRLGLRPCGSCRFSRQSTMLCPDCQGANSPLTASTRSSNSAYRSLPQVGGKCEGPVKIDFVRTLFHPHGFACQASQTSTLRVVMTLTAATDRVASRLPKSRLTTVSIRHDGSFVRARDLYFSLAPNRAIPPQKTIRLSS